MVRGVKTGAHLHRDVEGFTKSNRRGLAKAVGERAAVQKLHHDVRRALVLAEFEDRDDVDVLKPRGGLGLTEEAGVCVLVAVERRQHHLCCDLAIEHGIPAAIQHSQAALAYAFEQFVASDAERDIRHEVTEQG